MLTLLQELRRFALKPQVFLEGGKVAALRRHIERCQKEGKRMLLFSQVCLQLNGHVEVKR